MNKRNFKFQVSSFILFFLPSMLFAAAFTGGSYDGYDFKSRGLQVGYPSVVNTGATNITDQSAWMNGTLVATGTADTVVYLYWGTVDGGATFSWEHSVNFGVCQEYQALTTNAVLAPNTTYYYRYYAIAGANQTWANASATFQTLGPPVMNTGIGAVPVSFNSAILNGSIIGGGTANVTIYCGTDSNSWTYTNSLGTKSQGTSFSAAVSGLTAGTVYYYRCYGTNAFGPGWSDASFTTRRYCGNAFFGGSYDGYTESSTNAVVAVAHYGTVITIR